ncbi:hypothetical protein E2562_028596 [Oryza meyeriana var. granulata]|uniref:Uncharacterized protein n=1 Tax=Oryza meyeriana var. granulata TaxID=110450 RepID=A0A6G1D9H9_9ORYZ|nr:hypothetical protein E2562_028596 [Oryza meyeriana var. granulata]
MSTPRGSRAPTPSSGAGAGSRDLTPSDAATSEPTQGTDVVEVDSGDDPVVVGNKRKLKFLYVPHPHTAEVISEVLHDILMDWHIEKKVSTVTLDNCSTNDNAMKELQDKMPLASLMLKGFESPIVNALMTCLDDEEEASDDLESDIIDG